MNERAFYFGPRTGLLGILTMPAVRRTGAPTVILLNAGLLHRVGPNRLSVDIARRLSAVGYPCLRFDTSGVGDSELFEGGLLDIERSRQDVIEAMDAMQDLADSKRFVLMGLCTGAYNAFRAALLDERVAGCVLLDGYSYPTRRSRFRHYRTRVFQIDRWIGYVKRRLGLASGKETARQSDLVVFENEIVPKDRFALELKTLLERGTTLLMIYTGMGPLAFNYGRQMQDAFPQIDFDHSATVQYYPHADHTFTLPGNRNVLLEDIEAWMGKHHSSPDVAAHPV